MATNSAPLIRHVSRRELAQNRSVWLATGGMYAVFALISLGMLMTVSGLSPRRVQVLVVLLAVIAVIHLRAEAPKLGSFANHLVVASAGSVVALAFWAFQPGGGLALGGMMFIGPLTAVRLDDRKQIIAHIAFANGLAYAVALVGGVDPASQIAIVLMSLATAVLGFSCVAVLEGAEAQGDELERLVRRDPLTGVGNRRLLDERLDDELRRHERTSRQLSLIALDLDAFKTVNDTLGHAAGDELLRDVAAVLVDVAENRDTVVRQGGDEFCLILPETSPEHAVRTANAIRDGLAKLAIRSGIGIASYPVDAVDALVLLHVADERLRDDKTPPARRAEDREPGKPKITQAPASDPAPGRMAR